MASDLPIAVYEKQNAQFDAVVQGIYESLMAKYLGEKSIYGSEGERLDLEALNEGSLSRREVRAVLSQAFAIATKQGQRQGVLAEGSQRPTAKGKRLAYKRQRDPDHLAQNQQDYEMTLSLSRKDNTFRIVQRGTGRQKRYYVEPDAPEVNSRGYKTAAGAKAAITRMIRSRVNPDRRSDVGGRARGADDLNAAVRDALFTLTELGTKHGEARAARVQVQGKKGRGKRNTLTAEIRALEARRDRLIRDVKDKLMDKSVTGVSSSGIRQQVSGMRRTFEQASEAVLSRVPAGAIRHAKSQGWVLLPNPTKLLSFDGKGPEDKLAYVKANPEVLFVYPSLMVNGLPAEGWPVGMTTRPNTVGIPVKWNRGVFFGPNAFSEKGGQVKKAVQAALKKMEAALAEGVTVAVPSKPNNLLASIPGPERVYDGQANPVFAHIEAEIGRLHMSYADNVTAAKVAQTRSGVDQDLRTAVEQDPKALYDKGVPSQVKAAFTRAAKKASVTQRRRGLPEGRAVIESMEETVRTRMGAFTPRQTRDMLHSALNAQRQALMFDSKTKHKASIEALAPMVREFGALGGRGTVLPEGGGKHAGGQVRVAETRGPAYRSGVREGREAARAKRASKRSSHQKGIGIAGVGRGSLDKRLARDSGGYIAAPDWASGADYLVMQDKNGDTFEGNIEYDYMGDTLRLSFGPWSYFSGIPKRDERARRKILAASSPQEASRLMGLAGRPYHGEFMEEDGRLTYEPLTPQQVQATLNQGSAELVEKSYRQLAQLILDYGYKGTPKEDERFRSPTIALGKIQDAQGPFLTYMVYGQGQEGKIKKYLDDSAWTVKGTKRGNVWLLDKSVRGVFSKPLGSEAKGMHEVLKGKKSRGEWYVYGPLARYGTTESGLQRAMDQRIKEFFSKTEEQREAFGIDLPQYPKPFRFTTKREALAKAEALDQKWGKKTHLLQPGIKDAFLFYVARKHAESLGEAYKYAAAAADALTANRVWVEGPGPPPREARTQETDKDRALNHKLNARLKHVQFSGFPFQYAKGGEKPTDVISSAPKVALIQPGFLMAYDFTGNVDAYRDAMRALETGDFPYHEGKKSLGAYAKLVPMETDDKGWVSSVWAQHANDMAFALARYRFTAEAIKKGDNTPKAAENHQKAKKFVGRVAGETVKALKMYGLSDAPVTLFLGLGPRGAVSPPKNGKYSIRGPGMMIRPDQPVTANYRDIAAKKKANLVIRKAHEKRGGGSDVMDAIDFLLGWKPVDLDDKDNGGIFNARVFMAQVNARSYLSYKKLQGETIPSFMWAQASDPIFFLSRAARSRRGGSRG